MTVDNVAIFDFEFRGLLNVRQLDLLLGSGPHRLSLRSPGGEWQFCVLDVLLLCLSKTLPVNPRLHLHSRNFRAFVATFDVRLCQLTMLVQGRRRFPAELFSFLDNIPEIFDEEPGPCLRLRGLPGCLHSFGDCQHVHKCFLTLLRRGRPCHYVDIPDPLLLRVEYPRSEICFLLLTDGLQMLPLRYSLVHRLFVYPEFCDILALHTSFFQDLNDGVPLLDLLLRFLHMQAHHLLQVHHLFLHDLVQSDLLLKLEFQPVEFLLESAVIVEDSFVVRGDALTQDVSVVVEVEQGFEIGDGCLAGGDCRGYFSQMFFDGLMTVGVPLDGFELCLQGLFELEDLRDLVFQHAVHLLELIHFNKIIISPHRWQRQLGITVVIRLAQVRLYYRMKFSKSPAWKMTGKHRSTSMPDHPAPNAYQVANKRPESPSWKMGTAKRDGYIPKHSGPGPGAYTSPLKINSSFGIITGSPSNEVSKIKKQPLGPGSYNPNYLVSKTSSKGFSITGKNKEKVGNDSPGPGQYEVKSTLSKTKYNFGRSERKWFNVDKEVPGPGVYEVSPIRPKYMGAKVGSEQRCKSAKPPTNLGPGQYQNLSMFEKHVNENKGFTFNHKIAQKLDNEVPGPGKYDSKPTSSIRPSSALQSRAKRFEIKENLVPGPSNYTPKQLASSPSWSCARAIRGQKFVSSSPGPGAYQVPSYLSIYEAHN